MTAYRELWVEWQPWLVYALLPLPGLSLCPHLLKSEGLDEFVLEISSRKLAVVVTGSGRAVVADSAPFPWAIERGTFGVLRLEICGRVGPFGSFASVGYH